MSAYDEEVAAAVRVLRYTLANDDEEGVLDQINDKLGRISDHLGSIADSLEKVATLALQCGGEMGMFDLIGQHLQKLADK